MGGFLDLLGIMNNAAVSVFGGQTPASYQAPGGAAVQILGIILASGMPESTAPGYYCDFFVTTGTNLGVNLPVAPVRGGHVTINGAVYYVDTVVADKIGNGFRLILAKDLTIPTRQPLVTPVPPMLAPFITIRGLGNA